MNAFSAFLAALMSVFGFVNKAAKSAEAVADTTMAGLIESRSAAYRKLKDFQESDEGLPEDEVQAMIRKIMEG